MPGNSKRSFMELFPALEHVPCPFIFSAPHMPNPWSIVESASPSQSQKRADQWWENLQATWQQHQLLGMIALGFLMIGGCTDRGEAGIFLERHGSICKCLFMFVQFTGSIDDWIGPVRLWEKVLGQAACFTFQSTYTWRQICMACVVTRNAKR